MIRVTTTPQQQAEIEAHLAKVRAGLHKPEPHDWGDGGLTNVAEMHRFRAGVLIREAARHARLAIEAGIVGECK